MFKEVLSTIDKLSGMAIRFPSSSTPAKIKSNAKFAPYFNKCVGVIDHMYVPAIVRPGSGEELDRWRTPKGNTMQKVFAACDFQGNFTYLSAGWEAAMGNEDIQEHASEDFDLEIGYYFLVDNRYVDSETALAPYETVTHHVKSLFERGEEPGDSHQLFNLRHAMLHSAHKRTVRILRTRFPILNSTRKELSLEMQEKLVTAVVALHNMVNYVNPEDIDLNFDFEEVLGAGALPGLKEVQQGIREDGTPESRRDLISKAMIEDYNRYFISMDTSTT